MVYAKYVKRGKKRFGPYYYKSVRDKKGKVRNVYIGTKPHSGNPEKSEQAGKPRLSAMKISLLAVSLFLLLFFGFEYSSFFIARENVYTQQINLVANENTSQNWIPENPGNLTSFRISGSIIGNGTARVYLKSKDNTYLVFDSSRLELINFTAEESPLTGFSILGEEANASVGNQTVNATENSDENLNGGIFSGQENLTQAEEINITADTNASVETSENITIPENTTSQENVTWIGENLTNETSIPIEEPDYEKESSFPPMPSIENLPPKKITTIHKFEASCIDTCAIELSDKEYGLVIEIDNGTVLNIDNATYTVLQKRNSPPELLKDIPDMSIYPGESKTINLSEYFSDPDGDPLEFSFMAEEQLTISIDSRIATITADPDFEEAIQRYRKERK